MTTVKTIAKNAVALTVSTVTIKLLNLVFIALLARYLGDVGYGKYSFAASFPLLFMFIHDFGFAGLTIREVAKDRENASKYLTNISLIKFILSIVAFIIVAVIVNILAYPHEIIILVYIFGITSIVNSYATFVTYIFRGFEKMEYEALVNILGGALYILLGISAIYLKFSLIEIGLMILLARVIKSLSAYLLCFAKIVRPVPTINVSSWTSLMKMSSLFLLPVIFVSVYVQIPIVSLSYLKDYAQVGWYNAAFKLMMMLSLLPAIFVGVMFPVFSRLHRTSIKKLTYSFEKTIKISLILIIPMAICGYLLADKIVLLIYGEQFLNTILVLQILVIAFLAGTISFVIANALQAIDRADLPVYNQGIVMVTTIILCGFLIPYYGYIGAAIAYSGSQILSLLVYAYFSLRHFPNLKIKLDVIRIILCSCIMGMLIYFARVYNIIWFDLKLFPVILTTFATIVYFVSLYITKTVNKDDIALIRGLLSKRKG